MKKEILFAIAAGGGLGLLIAFGAWRAHLLLKPAAPTASSTNPISSNSPTPTQTGEFKIIMTKPENKSVFTDTPIVVSGITKPQTWVVVTGEDADSISNSSDSGVFTANVDLEAGANQINTIAFDTDGSSTEQDLLVTYSSQFKETNGISYVGTVTDKTDSIIQIKNDTGDIQQIKPTTDAGFVDTRSDNTKQLKFSDIAIGDFLIAMGTKGSDNILTSSRVIVSDPIVKTTRIASLGVVTDDSGFNKFVMKNVKTGESITVTPGAGITVAGNETSFGKIANDEKVIVAGVMKDNNLVARTIQVLK